MNSIRIALLTILCITVFAIAAAAQEGGKEQKQQGPPPAKVVTAKAESGMIRPQVEIVGTVYYPDVSQVASEISGLVVATSFEAGFPVKKGALLARLDTKLLYKNLEAALASHKQALTALKDAELEYSRLAALKESESVALSEYDKARFAEDRARQNAASLRARAEELQLQIAKAEIHAPFAGVVLEEHAQPGEWVSAGEAVATVARNDEVDVVVDVPQQVLPFAPRGAPALVSVNNREIEGEVFAVIPRGDLTTRTFPVKVRVANDGSLAEGMEARVRLPAGEKQQAVLVPRDAVIQPQGSFIVYAVKDGAAVLIPVEVQAYVGMQAAVAGPGLEPGMDVVIKGNERLRPGQPVAPAQ